MSEKQNQNADRPAECRADLRSYLEIGRITAPHGVQGEVRVLPLTDRLERFDSLAECFLTSPDEKQHHLVRIVRTRPNPPFILVSLAGIESREAADQLRNWFLSVDREHAIELPADTWFVCDLIGITVTDEKLGELGRLSDVLQQTAQDVYVVSAPGQPDVLFPAAGGIVRRVSLAERRMEVRLPDGLLEVYRPVKPERRTDDTDGGEGQEPGRRPRKNRKQGSGPA